MEPPRNAREPALAAGSLLGPYRIERELGRGGMGIVYLAERATDRGPVALKVLRSELAADEGYRRRLAREARVACEARHRHLVEVLDAGEAGGRFYLAARYVPGGSLAERLQREGALPVEDVLRLAGELGAALDALHEHGLVHRDVKPANVMLEEDGGVALADFGLATGPAYTVLTRPGHVVGTLDYLAPELIRGEPATPASDVYALGCVVYEGLCGRPPFGGLGPLEVGVAHLGEEPRDPGERRGGLPPRLGWAVLQALAKEPLRRPSTGTAYAHLLRLAARP